MEYLPIKGNAPTTGEVLENVRAALRGEYGSLEEGLDWCEVYEKLSSIACDAEPIDKDRLKKMEKFLEEAITRGYTGYACFDIGVDMWAFRNKNKEENWFFCGPAGEYLRCDFENGDYTSGSSGKHEWFEGCI